MKLTGPKLLALVSFIISLSGCSLGIKSSLVKSYPALNAVDSVKVISLNETAPSNAEILGVVDIYDANTITCGYQVVIEAAKTEARKAGGNALKITEHRKPSLVSTCHQIKANILRLDSGTVNKDSITQSGLPVSSPNHDTNPIKQIPKVNNKDYKAFYLSAEGGFSWRTVGIDPKLTGILRDYVAELKSGYHYGFSGIYYFKRGMGIGAMYDNHISKHSILASAFDSTLGHMVTGELRNNISISLIAATIDFRFFSKTEINSGHLKLSLGYCGYKDEGGFISTVKLTSSTIALAYDFSYDFSLGGGLYLSPSVSYKTGVLSSYDVTLNNKTQHVDLDEDSYEGLSRFDLSVGLRYSL